MSQELTDAEWLHNLADEQAALYFEHLSSLGGQDIDRLRSIAAKLDLLEKYPHVARMLQAEASGKVPKPSDVASVLSWEIAGKYMKSIAKRVGLPEDAMWPDIMAKLERGTVEGWQPIETAPRQPLILWQPVPFERVADDGDTIMAKCPSGAYTGHWDEIDQAWCIDGGTWLGPFLNPTHWMLKPDSPVTITPAVPGGEQE